MDAAYANVPLGDDSFPLCLGLLFGGEGLYVRAYFTGICLGMATKYVNPKRSPKPSGTFAAACNIVKKHGGTRPPRLSRHIRSDDLHHQEAPSILELLQKVALCPGTGNLPFGTLELWKSGDGNPQIGQKQNLCGVHESRNLLERTFAFIFLFIFTDYLKLFLIATSCFRLCHAQALKDEFLGILSTFASFVCHHSQRAL